MGMKPAGSGPESAAGKRSTVSPDPADVCNEWMNSPQAMSRSSLENKPKQAYALAGPETNKTT